MTDREPVPIAIQRAVLFEAGHRCAIPTCRATTTEIAHITPWAKTRDNSFENLIALREGRPAPNRVDPARGY